MIGTYSVNEALMLNYARSISKSLFEAQMAPALQQFKFVAARLARTTTSLVNIQGSSRSSGSEEAKQLNSYMYISSIGIGPTPPADALNSWSPQKHQNHKLAPVAQYLYWLRVPRKLTSSGFSPSVGV